MTATSGGQRLGVALSGGGHRATVWGWDTLVAAVLWAAALREHAYLLTRVNAYVILGLRELPDDAGPFRRERFEALT